MAEGDTLVNSVIGAVVIVLTTPFIPFAPLVGGALSGYLQGRDTDEGITVGAIAGLLSVVPLLLLFVVLGNLFVFLFTVGGAGIPGALGGVGFVVVVVLFFSLLFYTVLLGAVGGGVGSYLKAERII